MGHMQSWGPETARILEAGRYTAADGTAVEIADALAACCDATRLYLPDDFDALWRPLADTPAAGATTVTVTNATTLAAARERVDAGGRVALLNFASARHPGGGFLGGARAQEESLARASGLYASLLTCPEFYAHHRQSRSLLYSDRVIVSPGVPVIRGEDGALLAKPWSVGMLTAAAPNVGALARNEPAALARVPEVLARRTRLVLAAAATHGVTDLVLGAWGCGVFGGDPATVADAFADALAEPALAGRFAHVAFAIHAPRGDDDPNLAAFRAYLTT